MNKPIKSQKAIDQAVEAMAAKSAYCGYIRDADKFMYKNPKIDPVKEFWRTVEIYGRLVECHAILYGKLDGLNSHTGESFPYMPSWLPTSACPISCTRLLKGLLHLFSFASPAATLLGILAEPHLLINHIASFIRGRLWKNLDPIMALGVKAGANLKFDNGLAYLCRDGYLDIKCYSMEPQLFQYHRPARSVSKDSDINVGASTKVREKGVTDFIVLSSRLNVEQVMMGSTDYIKKW